MHIVQRCLGKKEVSQIGDMIKKLKLLDKPLKPRVTFQAFYSRDKAHFVFVESMSHTVRKVHTVRTVCMVRTGVYQSERNSERCKQLKMTTTCMVSMVQKPQSLISSQKQKFYRLKTLLFENELVFLKIEPCFFGR